MAVGTVFGELVVDPVALAQYVASPTGPIMRDLMRRGTNVQIGARAQVGKRTRTLERSIVKRADVDARGPMVVIATDVAWARFHHDGTAPHIIRPRRRQVLRFPASGSRPGAVGLVFAKVVHHPGTQPNRFLTDNLRLAAS